MDEDRSGHYFRRMGLPALKTWTQPMDNAYQTGRVSQESDCFTVGMSKKTGEATERGRRAEWDASPIGHMNIWQAKNDICCGCSLKYCVIHR